MPVYDVVVVLPSGTHVDALLLDSSAVHLESLGEQLTVGDLLNVDGLAANVVGYLQMDDWGVRITFQWIEGI